MKQAIILAALSLSLATASSAQVVGFREPIANIGVKIGGNFEQISSAPLKSGIGGLVGLYAKRSIGKFGVRLEALASTAQYTTKYPAAYYATHTPGMDTSSNAAFQLIYLNVPLLFEFSPTAKLHLLLGPQFSYVLSATEKNKVYEQIYGNNDILTKTDFSIVAGAELDFAKKFQVGARLIKGVLDVNNSTYYLVHKPWTSTGAQISISYRIL